MHKMNASSMRIFVDSENIISKLVIYCITVQITVTTATATTATKIYTNKVKRFGNLFKINVNSESKMNEHEKITFMLRIHVNFTIAS